MSDPSRLRDVEATKHAGQLLTEGVAGLDRPRSATTKALIFRQIEADLSRGRPPLALWCALSASIALLLVAIVVRVHGAPDHTRAAVAGTRRIDLGQEAVLEVTAEGQIDLPPIASATRGRRVILKSGQVCAEVAHRDLPKDGPLIVEAPNLRVTVIGTHFCVVTDGQLSTVSVTQGRVRGQHLSGSVVEVGAGESLRSDDPRLATATAPVVAPVAVPPSTPLAAVPTSPPVTAACARARSVPARRECFTRVAQGRDLAAENALYGLGLLERDEAHDGPAALAAFRAYGERFPNGVFAPEAVVGSLDELLTEERYERALTEATQYLALGRDPDGDVALIRAQLLMGPFGRADEALPLLERLAESEQASIREEALFALGNCALGLGHRAEAKEAFQRYLAAYPAGRHAAEISMRLP